MNPITYIFALVMSLSGPFQDRVITDIDVTPKRVWITTQLGLVIEYPTKDTIWDGRKVVWADQEMGLLGIVSTPKYFYVNYSGRDSAQHIVRLPDGKELLKISHRQLINNQWVLFKQHKGGSLAISGKYLYIASGDGGWQGDPSGNAQNLKSRLGKILRYDLEKDTVGVWARGLRNPWKIWISPGREPKMYITDVGWHNREEFTVVPLNATNVNLGWNCYEGTYPINSQNCFGLELLKPTYEYSTYMGGSSITGGYVANGFFLYADHFKDTLFQIGGDTIKQKGIKNLTVIKDGYAADYNGRLYKLRPYQTTFYLVVKGVRLLNGQEVDEALIPRGMQYVKDGRIIVKQ